MYVSIDKYADHAPQNNRNSLDSINPVTSDHTSDNPVIDLSHFIDESQHMFVKVRLLLMEYPSILNTQHPVKIQAMFCECMLTQAC
jgi:hypothetical protein